MSLLPVDEAVARLLAGVTPLPAEDVPLQNAHGRVLAADLTALLTQPPFPASAMDGYAVRVGDATAGAKLEVVGMSRAGERFAGTLGPGQAVRIFTGAAVPEGADAILIQEDAKRDGEVVEVVEPTTPGRHIRPAGLDFKKGDVVLRAGRVLDPHAVSAAASMGHATLPVRRKPRVAILANGDELVPPGAKPGPDQIVSSNGIGLAALVEESGGEAIDLGIAPDRRAAIADCIERAANADIIVTSGGASVGEHDLVQEALNSRGMRLDFWKIAMRPGKPLMVGSLGGMRFLGLPGNPVSTFVCAHVFLKPLLRALLALPAADGRMTRARLTVAMAANDSRQDYVRARLTTTADGPEVTPFGVQDSSMLSTLAAADALIVRPVGAPAAPAGTAVPVLLLRR